MAKRSNHDRNISNFDPEQKPATLELIVYQISQLDKGVGSVGTKLETLTENINKRVTDLELWKASLTTHVSQDEFIPVKRIVYGMVGLVLAAVLIAMITIVLKK